MRWIFLLMFLLGCAPADPPEQESFVGAVVAGMKVENSIPLAGHDGKAYRLSDFKGKVVALFFGYTHCPDVCPTTMAELNRALELLGDRKKEVQVLFVTLDPERDTVEVLNRYVPYFNRDFIGLRAEGEATKKLAQDFKIFYSRQEAKSKSGYSLDHSAGVYVFDLNGNLRLYLNHGQTPRDIAHDLTLLLEEK